ncbi:heat-inducible transcription repressor HrcA [Mycoplasma testudineum]|uniref:Heat-inducible transcription repressor HrcA n=1 Tax=Mycoplasma testudineum TaxID=244584 RepID=A0A4R6IEQ7_9MOLU|nr:hypothetical protein [Mycoplasma testudineum]OYD26976.1 hypothetical protein CG473_01410 [Mycoplasma testudineum]TDO20522.1 heat-inducible transcription repressor HrcA [Mycoplasma testudineum]
MKDIKLNERQLTIFMDIVRYFMSTGEALGSSRLLEISNLKVSPATVRNIMVELEKFNLIEKSHISAGRVPSKLGLQFYTHNLNYSEDKELRSRMEQIFSSRDLSNQQTLEIALKTISDSMGITLIASEKNLDLQLVSLQLIPVSTSSATVIILTSDGEVQSNIINLDQDKIIENISLKDLSIVIRIFNERLKGVKLKDIVSYAEAMLPILEESIHQKEAILRKIISKIFTQYSNRYTNKVYGRANLIKSDQLDKETVIEILEIIETRSIWEMIDNDDPDEKIKIDIRDNNTSFLATKIEHENGKKEISVVGDNRIDLAKTKWAFELLSELMSKYKNNNTD